MANTLNSSLPTGSVGSYTAQTELDIAAGEFVEDVRSVGQRPGQPIKLRHHQRVPAVAGGQRQPQAGSIPVRAVRLRST
jgi:hypothetical protein